MDIDMTGIETRDIEWQCGDGEMVQIKDMHVEHMRNILRSMVARVTGVQVKLDPNWDSTAYYSVIDEDKDLDHEQ